MRGEWAYFEALLTPELCEYIIRKASAQKLYDGTVGLEGKTVDHRMRHSEVSFLERNDSRYDKVFRIVDDCVEEANQQWFGVDYSRYGLRSLQFTRYRGDAKGGGHYYRPHQDTVLGSEGMPTQRKLSVTVQLTDPKEYTGGDFDVHYTPAKPPADKIRAQGTVIVFPSLVIHEVTPVTSGVRHSLVGWYPGPLWR